MSTARRILSRYVILSALIVSVGIAMHPAQANASACTDACRASYTFCNTHCGLDATCKQDCLASLQDCLSQCNGGL